MIRVLTFRFITRFNSCTVTVSEWESGIRFKTLSCLPLSVQQNAGIEM